MHSFHFSFLPPLVLNLVDLTLMSEPSSDLFHLEIGLEADLIELLTRRIRILDEADLQFTRLIVSQTYSRSLPVILV